MGKERKTNNTRRSLSTIEGSQLLSTPRRRTTYKISNSNNSTSSRKGMMAAKTLRSSTSQVLRIDGHDPVLFADYEAICSVLRHTTIDDVRHTQSTNYQENDSLTPSQRASKLCTNFDTPSSHSPTRFDFRCFFSRAHDPITLAHRARCLAHFRPIFNECCRVASHDKSGSPLFYRYSFAQRNELGPEVPEMIFARWPGETVL